MQWLLGVVAGVEDPKQKISHKKFFASGAKRSAESIHRPWVNSTVSNQTIKNAALQLLVSAIARFCDIKTLRSTAGLEPAPVRHL